MSEALETVHQTNLTPHLAELAHHYRESVLIGDPAKAIDYSIRAGEAALAVSAYEETRHHWQAALALLELHDPVGLRGADLLHRLALLIYEGIDSAEGIAQLESALKLFRDNRNDQRTAAVHLELGYAKTRLGPHVNISEALTHYRAAEALIDSKDVRSLARLYQGLAVTAHEAFLIDEALAASSRAMKIYEELGADASWSVTAAHRARCLLVRGRLAESTALLDRIREVAFEIVDPEASRDALWAAGVYYRFMLAPVEARRLFTLGLERPGLSKLQRQRNLDFLADVDCMCGDLTNARERHATIPVIRARIALREGDWELGRALFQEQLELQQAAGGKWVVFTVYNSILEMLYLTGDHEGAVAVLPKVLDSYGPMEEFCEMKTRLPATLLAIESGNIPDAWDHLEHCRRIIKQGEDWLGFAGSMGRAEGAFALADGRMKEAEGQFEQAMRIFRRFGLAWETADTLHCWGRGLLNVRQKASALEKFDAAIDLYSRHCAGRRWIDRVQDDRRRALDIATPPTHQQVTENHPEPDGCFRKEAEVWTICYDRTTVRLRDAKGLRYIAYLLAHPGEQIHVFDLVSAIDGATGGGAADLGASNIEVTRDLGNAGPACDPRARQDYRRRLAELNAEMEECRRLNDLGRAEKIQREIEFIAAELSAVTGLHGRSRKTADHAERTRGMVTKRIRATVAKIQEHNPSLGHHFSTCIKTGLFCAYLPDPNHKIDWQF